MTSTAHSMDLQKLQAEVVTRWRLQKDNPCYSAETNLHMLVHLTKALGKVAAALNDAEHERRIVLPSEVEKFLADLVICSARIADNVGAELGAACESRLAEKFPRVVPAG